jgi:hypothetical protein
MCHLDHGNKASASRGVEVLNQPKYYGIFTKGCVPPSKYLNLEVA